MRVTPVAGADEWAQELLAMYVAWAERTGRDASALDGEPFAVSIDGPSTFALLRHEAACTAGVSADAEPQLAG